MKSKKRFLRMITLIVGVMLVFTFIGCGDLTGDDNGGNGGSGGGGNPTITIRNNTGYDIGAVGSGVWLKPSTETQNWGSNFMGMGERIYNGESRTFTLLKSLSVQSVYDIRLQSLSGAHFFIKYGVTVSNGMTITFSTSDLDNGSTQPNIVMQNRSGVTFNSIHIKPSVISEWSESFGSISNNANRSVTILTPPSNYTVFDIQMRSSNPSNTYTRNNVTISNGMTFTFTSADRDNPTIELPVIVIQNDTGYDIGAVGSGVWIRPSTETQNWGSNFMGMGERIYTGESRAFTLSKPLSVQSVYDIRLQSLSGTYFFIKYNVSLTEGMIVTFTTNDLSQ